MDDHFWYCVRYAKGSYREMRYLAGKWSCGRLKGVQIGSPTKRRMACQKGHN